MATEDVFTALADPTRRQVIESLAARGECTATSLAAELPISRQAVAKHLSVLQRAHLVGVERVGREARYSLDPEPMSEAAAWMERVGGEWDRRIKSLRRVLS